MAALDQQPSTARDAYRLPGLLLALLDAVVFALAALAAQYARVWPVVDTLLDRLGLSRHTGLAFEPRPALWLAGLCALIGTLVLWRFGAYRQRWGFVRRLDATSCIAAVLVAFVFVAALLFGLRWESSRFALALAAGLSALGLVALTHGMPVLQRQLVQRGWLFRRAVVAAPLTDAAEVLEKITRFNGSYYHVLGLAPDHPTDQREVAGTPVRGSFEQLVELAREDRADCALLALPCDKQARLLDLLKACRDADIDVRVVPDLFDALTGHIDVGEELDALPIETLDATPLDGLGRRLKRLMDLTLGGLGLILVAPLLGVLALLIRLDSPGPVLYHQRRVGSDGRVFDMYKLRSMRINAEGDGQPGWTVPGDPRVTRLGRWLRRLNLDELPQLYNVVRGEMSLVGPRPERPEYVNQFKRSIPRYMRRHLVKSGLTGLAQVAGLRGNTSIEERLRYDLHYIEHWSIGLDIHILWRTLWAWRNAY